MASTNANGTIGVGFIRKEITSKRNEWAVIRDCLEGEQTIKSKGFTYLPYPSTNSKDENCTNENDPRYMAYKDRANFMNVTRRTIYELLAQVFIKAPVVEVNNSKIMQLLLDNASGNGISLEQCAKTSLKYSLAYAYSGVLVDFPSTEKSVSVKDYNEGVYRPTITPYSPFAIRNFRVKDVGAEERLVLVVLQENTWEYDSDGFEVKEVPSLRVLRLDSNNEYVQSIYKSKDTNYHGDIVGWDLVSTTKPTTADGKTLNEIPFYFIGMENNNPYPDNPIMYDLATLNVSHYRNSADYEETMFVAGQATLFVSGLNTQDNGKAPSIKMGVTGGINLKNGGTAGLLQAKADSGLAEAMEKKERAMAKFGAKFLETYNVAKTAYQVKVENPSQGSILANCADNVSSAYTKALKFAHSLVNLPDDKVEFELNTDFEYNRVGTDEQNQIINAWVAGAISFTEMRAVLKRAGTATQSDEEAMAEIKKHQAEKQAEELKLAEKQAKIGGDNKPNTQTNKGAEK